MSIFDKFFTKFSYKFTKGYPDINDGQDVLLLESLISEAVGEKFRLSEKVLTWADVSNESRKHYRLSVIADKISKGEPFTLENGNEEVLTFADTSYADLFTTQKVKDIKNIIGNKTNTFPLFKDSKGNNITFRDIKKTKDLGGTGGSKSQTTERQERSLIDAINSVEGIKILVGKNGFEIKGIIKAEKQPDPPRAEAYADIRLERESGPYLLSAKGIQTPSIAGGGLAGVTQISDPLANFVVNFYQDTYNYYKDIFDKNDEIDYNTNLYKTSYFKDTNRVIPQDLIDDMLRGNEAMGGPVDGYYIGPMDVTYEINGNKIITNGDIIPLDKFAEKYEKIFMHIKKRSGDYYFTDALQTVNGVIMPLIFTNKPGGKMAKSRLGANPKSRGQIII
jgi:hypothetical protein